MLQCAITGPGLASLIDAESSSRLEALDRAREQIESERRSWGADCLAIVLDTTVLLEAGPRLAQMAWDDVLNEITRKAAFVIPIAAVEELDNLKDRGNAEPRNKARFALKWLGELVRSGNHRTPFPDRSLDGLGGLDSRLGRRERPSSARRGRSRHHRSSTAAGALYEEGRDRLQASEHGSSSANLRSFSRAGR